MLGVAGVPDGQWCSCATFHFGPACNGLDAAAWVSLAVLLALAVYSVAAGRTLWRTLGMILRQPGAPRSPGPLCLRVLCIAMVALLGLIASSVFQVYPVDAVTLADAHFGVFVCAFLVSSSASFAFGCVALTMWETVEGDSQASARTRLALLGANLALLLLCVALFVSGMTDLAVVVQYAQLATGASLSLYVAYLLHAKFQLSLIQMQDIMGGLQHDGVLLVRLRGSIVRLRRLVRCGSPWVLGFVIQIVNAALRINDAAEAILYTPTALWFIISNHAWNFTLPFFLVAMGEFFVIDDVQREANAAAIKVTYKVAPAREDASKLVVVDAVRRDRS